MIVGGGGGWGVIMGHMSHSCLLAFQEGACIPVNAYS